MINWLNQIKKLTQSKQDFIVISVVDTKGSAPCMVGDKMICVQDNIVYGTIGGGNLEYQAIKYALTLNKMITVMTYSLGAKLGQCCGGVVTLVFEFYNRIACLGWLEQALKQIQSEKDFVLATILNNTVEKYIPGDKFLCIKNSEPDLISKHANNLLNNKQNIGHIKQVKTDNDTLDIYYESFISSTLLPVVIFGAGHITNALIPMIINLPIKLYLIDDREQALQKYRQYNNITIIEDTSVNQQIPNNAYYLIMSYSHQLDFDMCLNILNSTQFSYLGLIGSNTKAHKFKTKLKQRQVDQALIDKLICPIGKKYQSAQGPSVVAISLATQILEFLEAKKQ